MFFEREVGLSSHQRGQCTNPSQSSPTAQQGHDESGTRKSRRTSPQSRVKLEPEEDSFLLRVQKPEPSDVFDFLEPFHQLSVMKINSPPPSNGPDDNEANTLLKAQIKADKSSFKNSNCLPMPIEYLAGEDHADDLFNDPGEESEPMRGSVRGDAELGISSSDVMLNVLAAFPQPTSHIRQRPNASGS